MKNLNRNHYILIGIWFLLNLLQSAFTGLHSDESYYWMYSQNLAWGYLDHPPMVAFLIFLGHWLLPGELGVRLLFILTSTLTFALILNELDEKKDIIFLSIFLFSFPLMHTHIAGFMAIPDEPLLLFVVLFIIAYRKFLENPNWKISILTGIIVSLMIYSKYHAFLVVGFTIFSNLKLLKNKYFYGAVLTALLLLTPHIVWQIAHHLPTFAYHLVERAKPFRLKYVFPNIINQLVMAGPLTGILVFWKLFGFRPKNKFQNMLIFNILGFYILFFLFSFKNRIEAHWTASITPMLMFLTYPLIKNDYKIKVWFKRLAVPAIIIMLLFRIYIALDVIPNVGQLKITFYNRKASAMEIKKRANGMKVGFFNNYAATSNYIFYTGDSAVHLSTPGYRFCQYDLWNDEKYAEGDPLFTVQSSNLNPPVLIKTATGQTRGFLKIEEFQSLNRLTIEIDSTKKDNGEITFYFTLTNNKSIPIFTNHISKPSFAIMQNNAEIKSILLSRSSNSVQINPNERATLQITIPEQEISNKYPIVCHTRTKGNIRGELISCKWKEIP